MKLTRYDGHVPLFSQNMEGRERTLFGSTVQDDDINNQFTPEFLRGWGSVGSTEFPTLQDFNALAYTHNKLLSYLYQAGIPSYTENEEYYIGSIVQYNKDIYICLRDNPTVLPTDTNAWKRLQESLTFVGGGPEVMKRGAYGLGDRAVLVSQSGYTVDDALQKRTGFFINNSDSSLLLNSAGILFRHYDNYLSYFTFQFANPANIRITTKTPNRTLNANIYNDLNTRTDKNNVLHAGTTAPINTLNVSDMSQEVINNDLLTVTSGAVYRALQPKADSTYVDTVLGKAVTAQNTANNALQMLSGGDGTDYQRINTMMIQRGQGSQSNGQKILFPVSFKKDSIVVLPILKGEGIHSDTIAIASYDKTGFVAKGKTPTGGGWQIFTFDWVAIGEPA